MRSYPIYLNIRSDAYRSKIKSVGVQNLGVIEVRVGSARNSHHLIDITLTEQRDGPIRTFEIRVGKQLVVQSDLTDEGLFNIIYPER